MIGARLTMKSFTSSLSLPSVHIEGDIGVKHGLTSFETHNSSHSSANMLKQITGRGVTFVGLPDVGARGSFSSHAVPFIRILRDRSVPCI